MLKLCRVTKVKVLFLVLVYILNFNLFEFSAAILEKGLMVSCKFEMPFSVTRALGNLMVNKNTVVFLSCDYWSNSSCPGP